MRAQFLDPLQVERTAYGRWRLLADFRYYSALLGRIVTIPQGFLTDFASVPRLPLMFWLVGDTAHPAAVVHDYLYRTRASSRAVADAVFREAAELGKEPAWRVWCMWAGIRAGGWWTWYRIGRRVAQPARGRRAP